jgi:hypothetical protein
VLADFQAKSAGLSAEELEFAKRYIPAREDNVDMLKKDLQTLKDCPYLRQEVRDTVLGFYLDVKTGTVRQVKI